MATDKEAKANIERSNKITTVKRKYDRLEYLKSQLDSAAAKYQTPELNKSFKEGVNKAIEIAEKELKEASSSISKSTDKILKKEYNEFLSTDKGLASAVKYKIPKQSKVMAEDNKTTKTKKGNYKYDLVNHKGEQIYLNDKYASKSEKEMLDLEAEKIKLTKGADSEEYQTFQKNRYERVYLPEIRDGYRAKKDEAQARFDNAESIEDLRAAKDDIEKYKKVYDFTTSKDPFDYGADVSKSWHDFKNTVGDYEKGNAPEKTNDSVEESKLPEQKDTPTETKGGGGSSSSRDARTIADDLDKKDSDANYDDITIDGTPQDYASQLKEKKQALADYDEKAATEFQHDYAPDSQNDNDLFGRVMDAGRMVMGGIGASEEIPTYERGSMFKEAMGDAQRMKDMGLSDAEIDVRMKNAQKGYAQNINRVKQFAGGSSGVALANLGSAQERLYDQYGEIAATDEAMRRANRKNFQGMANRDEVINRQIFQDELSEAKSIEAGGAALMNDAINNMQERSDFSKMYGKGSVWYNRQKQLDKKAKQESFYLDQANQERVASGREGLESDIATLEDKMRGENVLNVSGKSTDGNRKPNSTVVDGKVYPGRSSVKKSFVEDNEPGKSLFKPKKTSKQKQKDILLEKMEAENISDDELMRLSSQYDKL